MGQPVTPAASPVSTTLMPMILLCVSTDGKPRDIVVLRRSGRRGRRLRSETQSAR